MNRRAFFITLLALFMPKAKAAPPVYQLLNGQRLHVGAQALYMGAMGGGKSVAMMSWIKTAARRGDSVYVLGRRSIK